MLPTTSNTINQQLQRAAFAMITDGEGEKRRYLLQWNHKWKRFNLIGSKVDNALGDNDAFARTLCREIEEEMGIGDLEEILVTREIKQIRMCQYSLNERKMKNYLFAIFAVSFFPNLPVDSHKIRRALVWLTSDLESVYVTKEEVMNLRTRNGRPISTTTRHILQELGELSCTGFQ